MVNRQGRKAHTVLGDDRKQVDLLVGVQVMQLHEQAAMQKGEVPEPRLKTYFNDRARREFVGSILTSSSKFNLRVSPGAPIETLFKSCGRFVRIKSREPAKNGGPGRYRYVAKPTATYLEILAAFNTQRDEEEARAGVVTERLEAYAMAIRSWPGTDLTFEEAFAAEAKARDSREDIKG